MARPDVLVVDDEKHILRAVTRVLGEEFVVDTTHDPSVAVARLRDGPPKVLITDFRMPVMDGVAVLAEACRVAPDTVRILMTGQAERQNIIEAINAGKIFRFIAKPWQNEALAAVVAEALQAHEFAVEGRSLRGQAESVSEIQRSIVPQGAFDTDTAEAACSATPCEFASGDYVDTLALPGHRTALLVGDVCGHGLGAAMYVFAARALLRSGLLEGGGLAVVLERTNRFLARDMEDGRFLTLFAAIHDARDQTLSFSNAGHMPPALVSEERLVLCERTSLPLGLFDDSPYKRIERVPFTAGQTLVACTDGVIEARNDHGDLYGMERLVGLLESRRADAPQALVERIRGEVRTFMGRVGIEDDVTLLVYRPNASPSAVLSGG